MAPPKASFFKNDSSRKINQIETEIGSFPGKLADSHILRPCRVNWMLERCIIASLNLCSLYGLSHFFFLCVFPIIVCVLIRHRRFKDGDPFHFNAVVHPADDFCNNGSLKVCPITRPVTSPVTSPYISVTPVIFSQLERS